MEADTDIIFQAWRDAAEGLGIRVTAPYVVEDATGGQRRFHALVHDFGSASGVLVAAVGEPTREVPGYFASWVNPHAHAAYDRQTFIDVLEDWGWFGEGAPPAWYHGVSPWG